jgi:hypothetical protein
LHVGEQALQALPAFEGLPGVCAAFLPRLCGVNGWGAAERKVAPQRRDTTQRSEQDDSIHARRWHHGWPCEHDQQEFRSEPQRALMGAATVGDLVGI